MAAPHTALACLVCLVALQGARAFIPDAAADAASAWAPAGAESPSASLTGNAASFVIASGLIPNADRTGVRAPVKPQVPPVTWLGVANSPTYKAQVHAAAGALNLPPVNSNATVDPARARTFSFVNLGARTIWVSRLRPACRHS